MTHVLFDLAHGKKKAVTLNVLSIGDETRWRSLYEWFRVFVDKVYATVKSWVQAISLENIMKVSEIPFLDSLLVVINRILKNDNGNKTQLLSSFFAGSKRLWEYLGYLLPQYSLDDIMVQGQKQFEVAYSTLSETYGSRYVLSAIRGLLDGVKTIVQLLIDKVCAVVEASAVALSGMVQYVSKLTVDVVGGPLDQLQRFAKRSILIAYVSFNEAAKMATHSPELARIFLKRHGGVFTENLVKMHKSLPNWDVVLISSAFEFARGFASRTIEVILDFVTKALERVLFAATKYLPNFCTQNMTSIMNWLAAPIAEAQEALSSIGGGGGGGEGEKADFLDLQQLLKDAKKARVTLKDSTPSWIMDRLVKGIATGEEFNIKLDQFQRDRYENLLLRQGREGFVQLWNHVTISADALLNLYEGKDGQLEENDGLNDLTESYTGRTFEEFSQEYGIICNALKTALLLVVESQKEKEGGGNVRQRRRRPVIPVEASIWDCLRGKNKQATTKELFDMRARLALLQLDVEGVERSPNYQNASQTIAERARSSLARFPSISIERLLEDERAIIDENFSIRTKKQEIKLLERSIVEGENKLQVCKTWERKLGVLITAILVAGAIWAIYSSRKAEDELRLLRESRDRLEAITEAAKEDPLLLEFIDRRYIEANKEKIADPKIDERVVLREFETAFRRFPDDIQQNPNLYSDKELDRWGTVCFKSFDYQLKMVAQTKRQQQQKEEEERNSWKNRILGYVWWKSTEAEKSAPLPAIGPLTEIEVQQRKSSEVAKTWIESNSLDFASSSFGGIGDQYRTRLDDFRWDKFVKGVAAYEGDVVGYRRHLSVVVEMAVDIIDTSLTSYRKGLRRSEESTLSMAWRLVKYQANRVWDYTGEVVQATGLLGADTDFAEEGSWSRNIDQVTRGGVPFVLLQLRLLQWAIPSIYVIVKSIVLLLYGAISSLIVSTLMGEHDSDTASAWRNALSTVQIDLLWLISETKYSVFYFFIGRLFAASTIIFFVLSILSVVFGWLTVLGVGIGTVLFKTFMLMRWLGSELWYQTSRLTGRARQEALIEQNGIDQRRADQIVAISRQQGLLPPGAFGARRQ